MPLLDERRASSVGSLIKLFKEKEKKEKTDPEKLKPRTSLDGTSRTLQPLSNTDRASVSPRSSFDYATTVTNEMKNKGQAIIHAKSADIQPEPLAKHASQPQSRLEKQQVLESPPSNGGGVALPPSSVQTSQAERNLTVSTERPVVGSLFSAVQNNQAEAAPAIKPEPTQPSSTRTKTPTSTPTKQPRRGGFIAPTASSAAKSASGSVSRKSLDIIHKQTTNPVTPTKTIASPTSSVHSSLVSPTKLLSSGTTTPKLKPRIIPSSQSQRSVNRSGSSASVRAVTHVQSPTQRPQTPAKADQSKASTKLFPSTAPPSTKNMASGVRSRASLRATSRQAVQSPTPVPPSSSPLQTPTKASQAPSRLSMGSRASQPIKTPSKTKQATTVKPSVSLKANLATPAVVDSEAIETQTQAGIKKAEPSLLPNGPTGTNKPFPDIVQSLEENQHRTEASAQLEEPEMSEQSVPDDVSGLHNIVSEEKEIAQEGQKHVQEQDNEPAPMVEFPETSQHVEVPNQQQETPHSPNCLGHSEDEVIKLRDMSPEEDETVGQFEISDTANSECNNDAAQPGNEPRKEEEYELVKELTEQSTSFTTEPAKDAQTAAESDLVPIIATTENALPHMQTAAIEANPDTKAKEKREPAGSIDSSVTRKTLAEIMAEADRVLAECSSDEEDTLVEVEPRSRMIMT